MNIVLRTCTVLGLGAASLALTAPGASALSCVDPSEWYPDAEHVFVGNISDVDGARIEFEVREVWEGDDLAESVWLRRQKGLEMWFEFSEGGEVPDGYSSPTRYVVAVQDDLVVSPCGLSPVGSDYGVPGAAAPRPPLSGGEQGAVGVAPEPEPEASMAPLAAAGAGVVGAGALVALLMPRRRT